MKAFLSGFERKRETQPMFLPEGDGGGGQGQDRGGAQIPRPHKVHAPHFVQLRISLLEHLDINCRKTDTDVFGLYGVDGS